MNTRPPIKANWRCGRCGQTVDTLYFAGKLNICAGCRSSDRRGIAGHAADRLDGFPNLSHASLVAEPRHGQGGTP